jgi:hypothetical protein
MIVGAPPEQQRAPEEGDLESRVVDLVRRRSVTLTDLMRSLGLERQAAGALVDKLLQERKIKKVVHGDVTYFREFY